MKERCENIYWANCRSVWLSVSGGITNYFNPPVLRGKRDRDDAEGISCRKYLHNNIPWRISPASCLLVSVMTFDGIQEERNKNVWCLSTRCSPFDTYLDGKLKGRTFIAREKDNNTTSIRLTRGACIRIYYDLRKLFRSHSLTRTPPPWKHPPKDQPAYLL